MDIRSFRVLSVCTGTGAFELGLKLEVEHAVTACYVEREVHACVGLVEKMRQGYLDEAPIWSDIRAFDGKPWRGKVDCVVAGFPCQPFSRAGRRQGSGHEHWIWKDLFRVIEEAIKKKHLSERNHRCKCGLDCDRDLASALVIEARALAVAGATRLRRGPSLATCSRTSLNGPDEADSSVFASQN